MKRFIIATLFTGALILSVPVNASAHIYKGLRENSSEIFGVLNQFGDSILYRPIQSDINSVSVAQMKNNAILYRSDSLVIPDTIIHNMSKYPVKQIMWWAFAEHPKHVTSITLPQTYEGVCMDNSSNLSELYLANPLTFWTYYRNIYVDKKNPYYVSIEGVLFTKDRKKIVAYPPQKTNSRYNIVNGVESIGEASFLNARIDTLITPNSLKNIGEQGFSMNLIREIVLKDSIEHIGKFAFIATDSLKKIIFGKNVRTIDAKAFYGNNGISKKIDLLLYSTVPPKILPNYTAGTYADTTLFGSTNIDLYVPRKSLHLYQQAAGWKDCASILPIEPPIIVGMDTAEVSWVQNFSATGYMWTLYTDEARTQRFMSLTFDANGHLTHIDLNSGHMPARMPALYHEDGEEEKRFAEYYSFTISGLSPETKYYYTRQSMKGTEVIDEETGSFETLSEAPEGTDEIGSEGGRTTRKIMEDGQVLIKRGKTTYTLQGTKMK